MSAPAGFEDYDRTSGVYDVTRVPVGVEVILGHLALRGVPLSAQAVLDAGCGTGNYIAVLSGSVGKVAGVELNAGMLGEARSKLGEGVELRQGDVTSLPFDDGAFDAVVCNQVIHHLDRPDEGCNEAKDFPNISRFVSEAHRVLSPGGSLLINVCSQAQLVDGFWWADLIPEAMARCALRHPPLETLRAIMRAAKLETTGDFVPIGAVLQGDGYLDPSGPLNEEWRDGDSTWALATAEELLQAKQLVRERLKEAEMEAYLSRREALRERIGQTTFVVGRKGAE